MKNTRKSRKREFWETVGMLSVFFLTLYVFVWTPLSRSMGW